MNIFINKNIDQEFFRRLTEANGGSYDQIRRIFYSGVETTPVSPINNLQKSVIRGYLKWQRQDRLDWISVVSTQITSLQFDGSKQEIYSLDYSFNPDLTFSCGVSSKILNEVETLAMAFKIYGKELKLRPGGNAIVPQAEGEISEGNNRAFVTFKGNLTGLIRISN